MEKRKSPWGPTLGALAVLGAGITGAYVGESQRHGVRVPIQTDVTGKALYASKSTEVEIPENDYFMSVADKIDAMYVEPGQDHRKMAVGAVRGMVNYLADPLANFMNPQQFSAYLRAQQGQYEGIGVEVMYQYSKEVPKRSELRDRAETENPTPIDVADYIPDVLVTAVIPGSPADLAGMKPGDRIDSVDNRPVLSAREFVEFRNESKRVRESKLSAAEVDKALRALQDRANKALAPAKVRDLITLGHRGTLKVAWMRGDARVEKTMARKVTEVEAVKVGPDGTLSLRLLQGADVALRRQLADKKPLKIDLRNSGQGSYDVLPKLLSLLTPVGDYGGFANEAGDRIKPLKSDGPGYEGTVTLLVDKSTRGAAEVLAEALRLAGKATLEGDVAMAGERAFVTSTVLPDGSGYTIPTGTYRAKAKPSSATKEVRA